MNKEKEVTPNEYSLSPEAQYHEAYEHLLHLDRQIWQTLPVAVVVDGALFVSTFATVHVWWVREIIFGFALILTMILTFALIKHRYFSKIIQNTLIAIEKGHSEKCIQRTSLPSKGMKYWYKIDKTLFFQKPSAHKFFIWGMISINVLILILLYLNWAILDC